MLQQLLAKDFLDLTECVCLSPFRVLYLLPLAAIAHHDPLAVCL
jgi:hypothetical protein